MSEDNGSSKIPHFDGKHYAHWSEVMKNFLRAKGYWGVVERGLGEPIGGTMLSHNQQALLDETRLHDHKVKYYLFQALDREVFEQVLNRSDVKIIWKSLRKKYGGNDKVKKSLCNMLRREFEMLEMTTKETIDDYFAKSTQVANKLRSNGETITDTKIVQKILRTLTDKYTYIIVSIEESSDIETMIVDELQGTLTMHEKKFKRFI
ncbi:hypothetical protein LIER_03310 [Lithospermum erythrorhizon]|uniref:DUF4219 domain-containing protein n=1 Tax=Lithospermum erythrorhizon TaxID=34254 RepID=A0AAV3NTV9_LITER